MLFRDGKFLAYINITISPRKDVLFELVSIQIYSGNNHGDDNIDVWNQLLMFAINVISGGRLKKGKKKSIKCIFHARQSLMSKSRSKVKVLIYMPLNEDF